MFERFYRSTSARAMPGSGLGLAIVKQVVVKHGGTLRVEDTVPGGQPPGHVDPRGAARSAASGDTTTPTSDEPVVSADNA